MERYDPKSRIIIPNWREVSVSAQNRELLSVDPKKAITENFDKTDLEKNLQAWKTNKGISYAADLISVAFIQNKTSLVKDAIDYVLQNKSLKDSSFYKFVESLKNIEKFPIISSNDKISENNKIHNVRNILKSNPKNPLEWNELARLYTNIGLFEKAKNAMDIALQLSPNNRYIVRSASCFYYHKECEKNKKNENIEKALWLIRKVPLFKSDPWLMSIEISLTSKIGKESKNIKQAQKIIDQRTYNPFHLSELSSSLATWFHHQKEFKKAYDYFKFSLIEPHENSINQAISFKMFSKEIKEKEQINKKINDLTFPFEAKTHQLFFAKKYDESLNQANKWLLDQPFSLRPIDFGSYVCSIYQENYNESLNFLEKGLKIYPNNLGLLNNIAYDNIMLGKIELAEDILHSMNKKNYEDLEPAVKVCINATTGMLYFRKKNTEEGRGRYLKAIEQALQFNDLLASLAIANYAREEFMATDGDKESALNLLNKYCKNREEEDVKILYSRALKKHELSSNK